ncbi:MAG: hypothetical protein WBC53_01275 [Phycisphaerae bacterium]
MSGKAVTAALIGYLFNGLEEPHPDTPIGPDPLWMKIASRLERGAITVEDLPFELIDQSISLATHLLNRQRADGDTINEDLDKQVKSAECVRSMFENTIAKFGGKRQAIVHMIEHRFGWYTGI